MAQITPPEAEQSPEYQAHKIALLKAVLADALNNGLRLVYGHDWLSLYITVPKGAEAAKGYAEQLIMALNPTDLTAAELIRRAVLMLTEATRRNGQDANILMAENRELRQK